MASIPAYVQLAPFDVPLELWNEALKEIREILIAKAKLRAMIAYSELVSQVQSVTFRAFDKRLFAILGQLAIEEYEQGRPLLSVLVVHKTGDMKPGEGFFELAEALGRNTKDVLKTWIEELQKVFQYWNS